MLIAFVWLRYEWVLNWGSHMTHRLFASKKLLSYERLVLNAWRASLPGEAQRILDAQLEVVWLVQRGAGDAKVCFYHREDRGTPRFKLDPLDLHAATVLLCSGSAATMRAKIFLHGGLFFSIEFPKRPKRYMQLHRMQGQALHVARVESHATIVPCPAGGVTFFCAQATDSSLCVTLPNGYADFRVNDLDAGSAPGNVKWERQWDGQEWKFNPHWESLSQNWKNLTGNRNADPGEASNPNNQGDAGRWVFWVNEDWQPSIERMASRRTVQPVIVDGVPQARPMVPLRSTPFNRTLGHSNATDYPPPRRVNFDYALLCTESDANLVEAQAIRRMDQLFLGEDGRYTFGNRTFLEQCPVRQIPGAATTVLYGSLAAGRVSVAAEVNDKGYRWSDRNGNWADYNTQGQIVATGDPHGNTLWLLRERSGRVVGVADGAGNALLSLHYTGELLTEVRDHSEAESAVGAPGRSVKYRYDDKNRLTQVTDMYGNTVQHTYDAANRIIQRTDQEGRVERFSYAGQSIKKHIAADGAITDYEFEYDDANKQFISRITGPETAVGRQVVEYIHNRMGQLVRHTVNGREEAEIFHDTGAGSASPNC
ncbi:RHS repeat domain-containing protein [Verminephrobacter aporrectodeae]|uniref:RHS repeat protein n=1 Tax=Verminephrobacter aporrectodeae TaxID=1110389 RepID=UPI00223851AF|nr:RHS repeat protein [Verminephrobacter aporrectodeae]